MTAPPPRLAALLALLLLTPVAPAAGATPGAGSGTAPDGAAEAVSIPGPDGTALRGLLLRPADGRPGAPVVALHGCGGLGGPESPLRLPAREADWARRLVALGHPVLFPDSFGSRGLREVCAGGERGVTPEDLRRRDALAAADWASRQPWAAPGGAHLLGWSHGASTALAAVGLRGGLGGGAGAAPVRSAVALYPGCVRAGRALPPFDPAVPVLMLLGGADDWTPAAPCRAAAARARPGLVSVVEYPGAHHGFDQPAMPVRSLSGLAVTPRGDGRASMGTDPGARDDALLRVPRFLADPAGTASAVPDGRSSAVPDGTASTAPASAAAASAVPAGGSR